MSIPQQILINFSNTLELWLDGDNYNKAVKYGRKLDRLAKYLPHKLKINSYNLLYRGVFVKEKALQKCLEKEKPLVLKNRKYSSWTANIDTTRYILNSINSEEDEHGVILQRKFETNAALLDVPETLDFLVQKLEKRFYQKKVEELADLYSPEQEIIIKNGTDNFKFTIKDIYAYEGEDKGDWIYPHGKNLEKST